jgi:hypothetical protein
LRPPAQALKNIIINWGQSRPQSQLAENVEVGKEEREDSTEPRKRFVTKTSMK